MSYSLNRVQLIGNLGRDPESRTGKSGKTAVTFALATTSVWTDKAGERQEATQWHRCVCFADGLGKIATQYLARGSRCYVSGPLEYTTWTDKDGVERTSAQVVVTEIILLDAKPKEQTSAQKVTAAVDRAARKTGMDRPFDDDVPF